MARVTPDDWARFDAELDHIYSAYRLDAQAQGTAESQEAFFAYLLERRPEAVAGLLVAALDRLRRGDYVTFNSD